MLVLTRQRNERIAVTTPCGVLEIVVADIRGNHKVRLGFEAPKEFTIMRKELLPVQAADAAGGTDGVE